VEQNRIEDKKYKKLRVWLIDKRSWFIHLISDADSWLKWYKHRKDIKVERLSENKYQEIERRGWRNNYRI